LIRGERDQGGEVAAGRAAGHHDEIWIDAVGGSLLTDPAQGVLEVDEWIGKRRARAEPVVRAHADPALRGEMLHEGQALLVLAAHHPAAAVDLEQRGTAGGAVAMAIHVEAEAMPRALVGRQDRK